MVANPIDGVPPVVMATLDRQVWARDYAISIDRGLAFDCRAALDSFDLSELPQRADDIADGALNYGDDLYFASVDLGLVDAWAGPFSVYVDDRGYEDYLDGRVAREYGCELRQPALPWHAPTVDEGDLRRFEALVKMDDTIYDVGDERIESHWLLTVPDRYGMTRDDHLQDLWGIATDVVMYGWAAEAYGRLVSPHESHGAR